MKLEPIHQNSIKIEIVFCKFEQLVFPVTIFESEIFFS